MSLMFVIAGALGMLIGLGGYAFHVVQRVEDMHACRIINKKLLNQQQTKTSMHANRTIQLLSNRLMEKGDGAYGLTIC